MNTIPFYLHSLIATPILWLLSTAFVSAQWLQVPTIPAEHFYALYSEGNQLYAATANRVYRSDDGGENWLTTTAVHSDDDEIIDLVVANGTIYTAMVLGGCYMSTDGGVSWQSHNTGLDGLGAKNLSSLAMRGDSLFAATYGAGIFVKPLLPTLAPWSAFNTNMPWGNVESLSVNGNRLLAGAGANATLSINTSGNAAWNEIPFDQFNGGINLFLGAVRDSQVLLGAGSQGLYRSTDDAQTWTYFNPGVGFIERASLAILPGQVTALLRKPNKSFLYTTNDQGLNWKAFEPALPTSGIGYDLLAYNGQLFCARTNGLWVLKQSVAAQEPTNNAFYLGQNFPNPVTKAATTIPFHISQSTIGYIRLFDVRGTLLQQKALGRLSEGDYYEELSLAEAPDGIYYYTLETDYAIQIRKMLVQHND